MELVQSFSHKELQHLFLEGMRRNYYIISLCCIVSVISGFAYGFTLDLIAPVVLAGISALFIAKFLSPKLLVISQRIFSALIISIFVYLSMISNSITTVIVFIPLLAFINFTESSRRIRLLSLIVLFIALYFAVERLFPTVGFDELGANVLYFESVSDSLLTALFTGFFIRSHCIFSRLSIESAKQYSKTLIESNEASEILVKTLGEQLEILTEQEHQAAAALSAARLSKGQLEANKEQLEQFAYAASHDLKEPIRTIRSFLQIVHRKLTTEVIEQEGLKEYFDFVDQNTEAMQILLTRLLTYSRINSMVISPKLVSPDKILQYLAHVYGEGLVLHVSKEREDFELFVDLNIIKVIFEEIIANAVLFKKRGEKAVVNFDMKYISDGSTLLQIADQGIGIEDMYLEKVFGLFQRLNPQEQYPGSGLGLSLVRRMLEVSGGRIWLQSELGVGTTVNIVLPKGDRMCY